MSPEFVFAGEITGTKLLKARKEMCAKVNKHITTMLGDQLHQHSKFQTIHWIVCGALLEYLSVGISEANRFFSAAMNQLYPDFPVPESLQSGRDFPEKEDERDKEIEKEGEGVCVCVQVEKLLVRWVQLLHCHSVAQKVPAVGLRVLLDYAVR